MCDDIQGLCLDPTQVPGEDCSNPVLVDPANLPFVYLEDTTGSTDTASHSGGVCPGEGGSHGTGAGDHAFELSPTVAGVYEISLTPYGWDGAVYVVTDCADIDGSCVYSQEDAGGSGVETMQITLDATQTYYIIVDGWGNSGAEGPYQLYVGQPCIPQCAGLQCGADGCGGTCGACQPGETCDPSQQCVPTPGNTCASAFTIPSAPYSDTGDTGDGFGNNYTASASCPGIGQDEGEGSPDVVYEFTPTATADYTITYTPTFDGALYVVTDCADIPNNCLAASEAASQNPPWDEVITLTLSAGTTYYIIVDGGIAGGVSGTYSLDVCLPNCAGLQCGDDGCGGSCGACAGGEYCDGTGQCQTTPGDTCATAVPVTAVPYTASYDTSGLADDYSSTPGACPGPGYNNGVGSGDQAFVFTPATSQDYTITVTPSPTWDVAFYIITDCGDIANTCVGAVDGPGNGGAETTTVALTAGTTYYIVVDGWGTVPPLEEGPFTIDIQ